MSEDEEYELRWYQDECTTALMMAIQDEDCHPVAVAPTGSGKTVMICDFIDKFLSTNPHGSVLILSHIKEILRQDIQSLERHFGEGIEIGVYSAGLGSRTVKKITVAGIQSVWRKPELFQRFDVVIIDECHLITIKQSGMYRKFFDGLMDPVYVGFTATPFRLGHGYIHEGEGALFNNIAYDISSPENFNKLIEQGYLCNLFTKATLMKMDTSDVTVRMGDYAISSLSIHFDRKSITEVAVDEIIEFGANYKKWLIFGIDIDHAEHITKTFEQRGIEALCVHSKMDGDRDEVIEQFRSDSAIRAIINVDILTTGFDVPQIDLIAMLRPTKSPVIHVQTIGRGLRVAEGKNHCLVLDFAGNTARLGPINDVYVKQVVGDGTGEPITKECPECLLICHPKLKICPACGHEFVFKEKLQVTATTDAVIKVSDAEWQDVQNIKYFIHHKRGKPDSMRVQYSVGNGDITHSFSEWVCYDHEGFVKYKADHWVKIRAQYGMPMPEDINELLEFSPWLKKPDRVLVNLTERFPKIHDFEGLFAGNSLVAR